MIVLELKQAARRLGCTVFFVRSLIASGQIPYLVIGKKHKVTAEDLDDWITGHRERRPDSLNPPRETSGKRVQGKRRVVTGSI